MRRPRASGCRCTISRSPTTRRRQPARCNSHSLLFCPYNNAYPSDCVIIVPLALQQTLLLLRPVCGRRSNGCPCPRCCSGTSHPSRRPLPRQPPALSPPRPPPPCPQLASPAMRLPQPRSKGGGTNDCRWTDVPIQVGFDEKSLLLLRDSFGAYDIVLHCTNVLMQMQAAARYRRDHCNPARPPAMWTRGGSCCRR